MSKLSIPRTPEIELLLNDERVCKDIYHAKDSIKHILAQIQQDIVTEDNLDSIAPVVLAIKNISDAVLLFSAKGATLSQPKQKQ